MPPQFGAPSGRERREGGGETPPTAERAPILTFYRGFDGYSSTFRELPSRPTSGSALTSGNGSQRPLSTQGFLKSIRITEKTAEAGVRKPIYRVTVGPCPTIPLPRPATLGLRPMTDATIPTESGLKVSAPWRRWLPFVGIVASVAVCSQDHGVICIDEDTCDGKPRRCLASGRNSPETRGRGGWRSPPAPCTMGHYLSVLNLAEGMSTNGACV